MLPVRHRLVAVLTCLIAATSCAGDEDEPRQSGAVVHLTCATGDADAPCAFRPEELTVTAGTAVRWVNDDNTFHTVTSTGSLTNRRPNGRFDAVLDLAGEEFTHTFAAPGTFAYYCQPHAEFMIGTIRVVPG